MSLMGRIAVRILVVLLALGTVAGAVVGVEYFRRHQSRIYTDGVSVAVRASVAPVRNILWRAPDHLHRLINTPIYEYEPGLTADGERLYFVRGRAGHNANIYYVNRIDDGWSEPFALDAVNTLADELGPCPSPDGSALYFYSDRRGGSGGFDIWVVRKGEDGWSEPENLGPGINTRAHEYGPAITPDGVSLYFASNRTAADETPPSVEPEAWTATSRDEIYAGDYDIYVASLIGGDGSPAARVDELSSESHDGAPSISPLGDFIYFSSNRTDGFGGFDLYRARLNLEGAVSALEHLGADVNTPSNELDPWLSMQGFGLHFASDRPVPGRGPDQDAQFDVYYTTAREVYVDHDLPEVDWAAVWMDAWPVFLVVSFLLLLLWLLYRMFRDGTLRTRWAQLSLIAKCMIVSVVGHVLLMMLLALWQVTPSIGEFLRRPGATRVALMARSMSNDLAGQIRGHLTELQVTPSLALAETRAEAELDPSRPVETSNIAPESVQLADAQMEMIRRNREASASVPRFETDRVEETEPQSEATPSVTVPRDAPVLASDEANLRVQVTRANDAQRLQASVKATSVPQAVVSPAPDVSSINDAVPLVSQRAPEAASAPSIPMATPSQSVKVPETQSEQSIEFATPSATPQAASQEVAVAVRPSAPATQLRARNLVETNADPESDLVMTGASTTSIESASVPISVDVADAVTPETTAMASVTLPSVEPTEMMNPDVTFRAPDLETTEQAVAEAPSSTGLAVLDPLPDSAARPDSTRSEQRAYQTSAFNPDSVPIPDVELPSSFSVPQPEAQAELPVNIGLPNTLELAVPSETLVDASDVSTPVEESRQTRVEEASEGTITPREASAVASRRRAGVSLNPTMATNLSERVSDDELQLSSLPSSSSYARADVADVPVADAPSVSEPWDAAPDVPRAAENRLPDLDAVFAIEPTVPASEAASEIDAVRLSPDQNPARPETGARDRRAAFVLKDPISPAPLAVETGVLFEDNPMTREVMVEPTILAMTKPADVPMPMLRGLDVSVVSVPTIEPLAETMYPQRRPDLREALVEKGGGSEETEKAVADALAWLAEHQAEDGRWSGRHFDDECGHCGGAATHDFDRAVTGLALLCFLGADHTHTRDGPYRDTVDRGLRWLLSQQRRNGDLRRGATMYSHGIATIALCESYGMTADPTLLEPCQRAVSFIEQSRNRSVGGWRYEPGQPGDTSVLGWQIMALVSARRSGIDVADETFESADTWLDRVSHPRRPGRYSYQRGIPATHSMTAEGLFVRQLLGHGPSDPSNRESVDFILTSLPDWSDDANTYYWYYGTLAMFQNGGAPWNQWNKSLVDELLKHQRADGEAAGSWDPKDRWSTIGGRVYQTAICTLTLEVYYRYLPLYVDDRNDSP